MGNMGTDRVFPIRHTGLTRKNSRLLKRGLSPVLTSCKKNLNGESNFCSKRLPETIARPLHNSRLPPPGAKDTYNRPLSPKLPANLKQVTDTMKPGIITGLTLQAYGILALLLVGCGKSESQPSAANTMPPQQVTVLELQPRDLPARFEYVGRLEASREIEIRPRITGIIEQRLFDEGSVVGAGDPLFRIDAAPFEARRQAAAAALAEANARLVQTEREVKRLMPLANSKTISQRELDDARSNRDLASAAVAIARAELVEAELDLGYTEIKTPYAGRIGRALRVEGALVSPTTGPLAYLARIDPLYAVFSIAENDQLAIDRQVADGSLVMPPTEQRRIVVSLADGTDYPIPGRLDFSDYRTDSLTGAFAARATIDNPDGRLSPGQFVRVRVEGGVFPQALAIPQRAVMEDASGKYVYVAGQGEGGAAIALQKPVEVGQWVEVPGDDGTERLWIIRNGLAAGDKVVIEGTARIFYPGMPILPQPPEGQSGAPSAAAQTHASGDG